MEEDVVDMQKWWNGCPKKKQKKKTQLQHHQCVQDNEIGYVYDRFP